MNIHPLIQKIAAAGPVLSDGAWGTQLQARGLVPGEAPDLWNLTHPEKVGAVAKAYVAAGSQIILTNTFGANRFRLGEAGAADKVQIINETGARISREAAGGSALVFASIGPGGKLLMNGGVTKEELPRLFPSSPRRWPTAARRVWSWKPYRIWMKPASPSPPPRRPVCPSWPAWFLIPARTKTAR
jgi:methionine synthase I (cobalamin-dependent)